ncbi:citrate synthase [Rickettsiales bacterium]|nr:citrate synthase [Rickettsiales bacterium]
MIMKEKNEAAKLYLDKDSNAADLPILSGAENEQVVNVGTLHKQKGIFTYDPGFVSTASCKSAITFIDGEHGILRYRGYEIAELAEHSDYLEVVYLLLYGDLPNQQNKANFVQKIKQHASLDQDLTVLLRGFSRAAHPMPMLCTFMSALAAAHHDSLDQDLLPYKLIAIMPILTAIIYRYISDQELFVEYDAESRYCANFLQMMFPGREPSQQAIDAMEEILILHADHEQNASTAAVRLVTSTLANPFVCINAGISALWGSAHGGANEAVMTMLREIGNAGNIPKFISKAKDKNDPFRLMGFGHRVYKNHDPRAGVLRKSCHKLLKSLGDINNPLFEVAMQLEEIALQDEYFIERKLYPNVDFYSGIILEAIGIPPRMFTMIFALSRVSGWVAQRQEMVNDPEQKLCRPRQLYVGPKARKFVPISRR